MLKRVAPFHFSHRISDLSICTAQHKQFYGIDSQKVRWFFHPLFRDGLNLLNSIAPYSKSH